MQNDARQPGGVARVQNEGGLCVGRKDEIVATAPAIDFLQL